MRLSRPRGSSNVNNSSQLQLELLLRIRTKLCQICSTLWPVVFRFPLFPSILHSLSHRHRLEDKQLQLGLSLQHLEDKLPQLTIISKDLQQEPRLPLHLQLEARGHPSCSLHFPSCLSPFHLHNLHQTSLACPRLSSEKWRAQRELILKQESDV